jgi:hypothetical protein
LIFRYQLGAITFEHPYVPGARIPPPRDFIHSQVKKLIDKCLIMTDADDYRLAFTGAGNFRFEIAKEQQYKGNRDNVTKPYHWGTVHEYILEQHGRRVVTCIGYEADDYLAFHRTTEDDKEYFICTRDKDLDTVPGWHYRWACGVKQPERPPYYITDYEAFHFFLLQCLMGDNTDHIPGCGRKEEVMWGGELQMRRKGVGPKAAENLLDEANNIGEEFEIVTEAYKERFEGEDYMEIFLENARLLYMGQRMDNLFEWSWLDPFLHLRKGDDKT